MGHSLSVYLIIKHEIEEIARRVANSIQKLVVGGEPKSKIWSSLFWSSSFCYLIMYVVLVLILLFLLVRERYVGMKIKLGQFFHKKSGSQKEDNQASILGCPHLFFGC